MLVDSITSRDWPGSASVTAADRANLFAYQAGDREGTKVDAGGPALFTVIHRMGPATWRLRATAAALHLWIVTPALALRLATTKTLTRRVARPFPVNGRWGMAANRARR